MGKYDFRPARVHQAATQLLDNSAYAVRPPWYEVVGSIPPPEILTRSLPVQHSSNRKGTKKPSKLFKPQNISYPEDSLRKSFFSDHPWELARPRVVLEDDGADYRRKQWDTIRQPGGQLSGENVVQRQAWLMEQKNLSKDDAYDQARREFYDQRMKEDIERRVAKEEATATGAYFGRTRIGIGADLENKSFEVFRAWAEKTAMQLEQARTAVYSGVDTTGGLSENSSLGGVADDPSILAEPGATEIPPEDAKGQPVAGR